ncbi:Bacilysin biosynthesis oxidoreductase BacC [Candidatus Sulfotelmatobacter kueseliae]|uniref:Bacilysin biosynthesis oxidoreductase BacC n=1 Tax=Candidatus Sulfotelmatobacter kueseliae TaxID=2042962 RepID=A0A2U3KT48_9BACT|nr:Bacilysin biosynthesis oxidoreductase BacC [Candidatus Sulfotelmatobacter kueseliae]
MDFQQICNRAGQSLSLQGKVAIVTGAASGIGRAIAIRLAEMGAAVAVLDKNSQGGNETVRLVVQLGCQASFIPCDVSSQAECREAVQRVIESHGSIDILCNNAGITVRKDVLALEEEEWDAVLDVTLKGAYLLSREVIPHMIRQGGGAIINMGSGWSLKGGPKAAAYCAAKAGVLNLTRAMAIDHGKDNIRVNCVCPGDVNTPMLESECLQLGEAREQFMKEAANRPLGRVGTPEDVANAVLFLASDMSKWITGAQLVVDGGGIA